MSAGHTLRAALQPLDEEELRRYRLTASQWQQIQATREFKTNPQWRLAQLDGNP